MLNVFKKIDKNQIFVGIAIIAIIIVGILIYGSPNGGTAINLFGPSNEEIGERAVSYINNNGLSSTLASLVSVSNEDGLVKIKIKIDTQEFDSYATKSGKLFFPQGFDMSGEAENTNNTDASDVGNQTDSQTPEEAAASINKLSSPMLEAYVVSKCPFGLQLQRAMAKAVEEQPSLAPYLKPRYIGSVSSDGKTIEAMHGEPEATENLRQICIREEQADKYWNYISCHIKAGETKTCESSTGVDSAKLSACIANPSLGVAYAKEDFDLSSKYSAFASPTMVLNEAVTSSSAFGGRSADAMRSMVCAGFETQPEFCAQELDKTQAATSFSAGYAGSGSSSSAAECGI